MSSIIVNSVRYFGVNPNQTVANITVDGETLDFFVALDREDDSECYRAIMSEINNGNIEIQPSEINMPEYLAADIREKRNKLLSDTDKYMTLDYPISDEQRELIRQYRQLLRDITDQEGFPFDVEWPINPLA